MANDEHVALPTLSGFRTLSRRTKVFQIGDPNMSACI
jgi:hypothetical protein